MGSIAWLYLQSGDVHRLPLPGGHVPDTGFFVPVSRSGELAGRWFERAPELDGLEGREGPAYHETPDPD